MRLFKYDNIVYVLSVLLLASVMYVEYVVKKDMYKSEKIYDLNLQYKNKILFNDKLIDALFDELFQDLTIKKILLESTQEKIKIKIESFYTHYT